MKWKSIASAISGLVAWTRPFMRLYSAPGYVEDGQEWAAVGKWLGAIMTPLDWVTVSNRCLLFHVCV